MPVQRVIDYLTEHDARYTTISHSLAHTTQDVAELTHIRGINMGKVIVLDVDGLLALMMIPAHYHVVQEDLQDEIGANNVTLAAEVDFIDDFPGA